MSVKPARARVHTAKVMSNAPVADGMWLIVFQAPALAANLASGQFVSIEVPHEPHQLARVPLSHVSCDFDLGTVELVYAVIGKGTKALTRLQPGDKTTILGPGGHGWELSARTRRCLLMAGGFGIAPIASAAQGLGLQGLTFDVVIGARSANKIWGIDRVTAYGADNVIITTDDGSAGAKGQCTDVLEAALPEETYDLVLACGPEAMLKKVARLCGEHRINAQISLERMMTCGFGACMTCVVNTKTGAKGTCMHGPVMKASEVVW